MPSSFVSGGRTIRLQVAVPATPGRHPALILLHGAGGNAGFWADRLAPAVASLNVGIYAVLYFDRTGTVRPSLATLSDGVHVPLWLETIRDALAHIASLPDVDPDRIALVGVSLGGFLALALAATGTTPPVRALVEISGGLVAPYSTHATAAFPPTLIVHGEEDNVVELYHAENLRALLETLKVPHQTDLLPGEGHYFSSAAQSHILASLAKFLVRHL